MTPPTELKIDKVFTYAKFPEARAIIVAHYDQLREHLAQNDPKIDAYIQALAQESVLGTVASYGQQYGEDFRKKKEELEIVAASIAEVAHLTSSPSITERTALLAQAYKTELDLRREQGIASLYWMEKGPNKEGIDATLEGMGRRAKSVGVTIKAPSRDVMVSYLREQRAQGNVESWYNVHLEHPKILRPVMETVSNVAKSGRVEEIIPTIEALLQPELLAFAREAHGMLIDIHMPSLAVFAQDPGERKQIPAKIQRIYSSAAEIEEKLRKEEL